MIGPCSPYNTVEALKASPDYCAASPEQSNEVLGGFIDRADEVMYVLTGRQFPGDCSTTRWPVRRYGGCNDFQLPFAQLMNPRPRHSDAIALAGNPRDIVVKIDGAKFDDWQLRDGIDLVRTDGKAWPATNNLNLPDTQVGTFTIRWVFGPPTPGEVQAGSLELAVQYQLASIQDARCKLDPAITSMSRQGSSFTIDREVEAVRKAGPALQSVMVAMGAFNPTNARQPPSAWSPDHLWELVSVTKPVPA